MSDYIYFAISTGYLFFFLKKLNSLSFDELSIAFFAFDDSSGQNLYL